MSGLGGTGAEVMPERGGDAEYMMSTVDLARESGWGVGRRYRIRCTNC